ncbi:unnamed protein product [Allacma fusca]|uniref:Uncharacterized protein n=1 Tax=Allacma fusca TaxID=39272 RepID=A0A8J2KH91_9HEXA|nr:unnamed protein product [Allacma fusca]
MALRKNLLIIRLISLVAELASLCFLFHSVLHDFRSWNNKFPSSNSGPPEGDAKTKRENQTLDIQANCSKYFNDDGKPVDFRRSTVFGIVIFVTLLFFWWFNSLYVCIYCRVKLHLFSKIKYLNLVFTLIWLIGGTLILGNFFMQKNDDKQAHRLPCVYSKKEPTMVYICQAKLCQASTSKLIAFGCAFLSGWLHLLCFVVLLGQDPAQDVAEDPKSGANFGSGESSQRCSSSRSSFSRLFSEHASSHLTLFPFNLDSFPYFGLHRSTPNLSNPSSININLGKPSRKKSGTKEQRLAGKNANQINILELLRGKTAEK